MEEHRVVRHEVAGALLELTVGDIVRQDGFDAVVNAANAQLRTGGGVAGAIHRAAGPGLAEEAGALAPISPGQAVITSGHALPNRWVIHCLGPVHGRDRPEDELLASCYREALRLADEREVGSVAFPALSTGAFGYPMQEAARVALGTVLEALPGRSAIRRVRFVLHDEEALRVHERILRELVARGTGGRRVNSTVTVRPDVSALLLVDLQPDFCPGGALPVDGGDEILRPAGDLMRRDLFGLCVATQDWHPANHVSFASNHEGRAPMEIIELQGHEQVLWPDHCVQGTPGAELHPAIDWTGVSAIIRKGGDPSVDSYSGFRNNWSSDGERPRTGLAGYLRERGVEDVYLCGLARDVCVKWTAEDSLDAGFRTVFLWDLTRSVRPERDPELRLDLEARGIVVAESGALRLG